MSTRLVVLPALLLMLLGCGPNEVALEDGEFTLVREAQTGLMESDPTITLSLDLDADTVEIMEAGDVQSFTLERMPKDQWTDACPTMGGSQLLEWARLDGPLTLDGVSFAAPVVQASCETDGKWMLDGELVSNDRALRLGEEADLVDQTPSEGGPEPQQFMPTAALP